MAEVVLHRNAYIARIRPFIGKQVIKVLTGQRRVGKSYLLFQLMEEIRQQDETIKQLYINLEDLTFSFIRDFEDLNRYVLKNKNHAGKTAVFIDEIQDVIEFERALRSLLLDPTIDLYCTGSNANLLSGELATFLSGRYVEINVQSLSFLEFCEFHQLSIDEESLEWYLKIGGLPYLMHLPKDEDVIFEYLKNIYTTILYRDVVQRHQIRNSVFLERLIQFLADNTGSLFSAKKISDFLKSQRVNTTPLQVQQFVQHVCDAMIIHRVQRYDIKGKKLFEIGEKFYFENLGIRHAIWGYRFEDFGKILENSVYNHLIFKGFDVRVGVLHPFEIDFIAEKKNERMYIQVALELHLPDTIEREFGNLLKIRDNFPKYVITRNKVQTSSYQGVHAISLFDFLTKF